MTREEVAKIITIVTATYPNHFAGYSKERLNNLVNAWLMVLEDYTYQEVNIGLKVYLSTDSKGFPPSPGQIVDSIQKARPDTELTAMEAWQYATKALRNGLYNAENEYNKLPPMVQKAVGSPATLREWALMDSNTVHSVEQSHFIRIYDSLIARQKEINKLPQSVKMAIGVATKGMING